MCPWNGKFSQDLAEASPFRAREFIAGKDAVTLATDLLALDQEAFTAAFRRSPMKRAKLAGLKRNAAVVLENQAQQLNFDTLTAAARNSRDLANN